MAVDRAVESEEGKRTGRRSRIEDPWNTAMSGPGGGSSSVRVACGRADRDRARGTVDASGRNGDGVGHDVEMRNGVIQANLGLVPSVAGKVA